jgi:membrane protease YdiL (CAAX protease family)
MESSDSTPAYVPGSEPVRKKTVSKGRLVTWLILTPITLFGIIGLAVTLFITAWYTERGFAGMPHPGSLPAPVRDMAIPTGTIIGEWLTVWLWWSFFKREESFPSLFQTRTKTPWMEMGIGVIAGGVLVFLAGFMRPPVPHWAGVFLVLSSITAGFCEEFLFRGFLISLIRRAGLGWVAQILLSVCAFGAGHVIAGPWGIAWAAFVGLVFGAITIRSGNVWAAVVAHVIVDICVLFRLFPFHL